MSEPPVTDLDRLNLLAELRKLRVDVERLLIVLAAATQGLHDIRGVLGFDNDGDRTPAAQIAGAKSIERYVEQVIEDVREHRADDDEADREHDAEMARRDEQIAAVRALADKWEHGALRWADPLPVPPEVALIRAALDGGAS